MRRVQDQSRLVTPKPFTKFAGQCATALNTARNLRECEGYTKCRFGGTNVPQETRVSAYPKTRSDYDIIKANWYYIF